MRLFNHRFTDGKRILLSGLRISVIYSGLPRTSASYGFLPNTYEYLDVFVTLQRKIVAATKFSLNSVT